MKSVERCYLDCSGEIDMSAGFRELIDKASTLKMKVWDSSYESCQVVFGTIRDPHDDCPRAAKLCKWRERFLTMNNYQPFA